MNTSLRPPTILLTALALVALLSALPSQGHALGQWFQPQAKMTTLHTFYRTDEVGSNPQTGLVLASDEMLYGTTQHPGAVFRFDPKGDAPPEIVCDPGMPPSGPNGEWELSTLIEGPDGAFYGVSPVMADGLGAVFRCTPGGDLSILHAFEAPEDGLRPVTELIVGPDNALYGTTSYTDETTCATVFRLDLDSDFEVLAHVSQCTLTRNVHAASPLVFGSDGHIYGTFPDEGGDSSVDGYIYRVVDGEVEVLFIFDEWMEVNYTPMGNGGAFVEVEPGVFWGGRQDEGFWKATIGESLVSPRLNQSETRTGWDSTGLVDGGDGWLYGTMKEGALGLGETISDRIDTYFPVDYPDGNMHRVNPTTHEYQVLHWFARVPLSQGEAPQAPPTIGPRGALYGTTIRYGEAEPNMQRNSGQGTIWELQLR